MGKIKFLKKEELRLEKVRQKREEEQRKKELRQEKLLQKKLHKQKLQQEELLQEKLHKQKLFQEKLKLMRMRACIARKEADERKKLRKKFLDQRKSDLQYEKMHLLLDQEILTSQNKILLRENSNLKTVLNIPITRGNSNGSAVKHASFVSVPRLKEWVAPKGFFNLKDIFKSVSRFSLLDFLTNPDDTTNDHLLSLVESNQVSIEKNKHVQEFGESSSKNQVLEEIYENLEVIDDDFLESFVNGNFRSKLILKVSPSKNSTDVVSSEANHFSLELPPQWSFDDVYEEIN